MSRIPDPRTRRDGTLIENPKDVEIALAAEPDKVNYTTAFTKKCSELTVTFNFTWNVWRVAVPAVVHKTPNVKRFRCNKSGESWSCTEQPSQARYVSVLPRTLI